MLAKLYRPSFRLQRSFKVTSTCVIFLSSISLNLARGFSTSSRGSNISTRINSSSISSDINTTMPATVKHSTFEVSQFPCLDDNYGYLIHDPETGDTAAIDTPNAKAYTDELNKRGWKLSHIFCTHHHWDHTGGNLDLKTQGVTIYGAESEASKIPGIDVQLKPDDIVTFGNTQANIIDVGGHTLGHIAFHFSQDEALFCGDALFALGCGKMFEGTPPQFWNSLQRLRNLPDATAVYCAHEYTASNAKFAVSVEPGNKDLIRRNQEIIELRLRSEPTIPTTIGLEKQTNPFLRGDISAEIRNNVGATDDDGLEVVFGKIRKAKDTFRG